MRKIFKVSAILILVLSVYSFIPVIPLYISTDPTPYTNEEAAQKLASNTGDYFEFIVLGDNHAGLIYNDSAALKIIRNINREDRFKKIPVDFVEISGDISFRGSVWDYRIFNKIRSRIKMPVICAMGNHDDEKDDGSLFKKYTGSAELSFVNRNSYFIVINNGPGELTEKQFSSLEDELINSFSYKHRFIFLHKPPVSTQESWYRPELSPWSYRFMKICEKYKVDMVFSGHEHIFKESNFGGVKYIVSSGGGILINAPKQSGGVLHYVVVRVYGDYVDYEVRKVFPPFWEFVTYYMWKDIFYFLKGLIF